MVDVFHDKFAYLKVDPEFAQAVVHPESYIKSIDKKGKRERAIYFNVSYDEEEKQKIKEIEMLAQQNNVNHALFSSTGQILKFIYANQFDTQKTYENMISHIQWVDDPKTFSLSPLTLQHLQSGYIYIAGVDKQMRPTCVFNVDKIDLENSTEESIIPAYSRVFKLIEEYFYYKSKIESWNVIIETNEIGVLSLPRKILGKIISTMQNNFPSNLNRICILNPSTSLNLTWNVIAAFINERSLKKISFLKKSEIGKLLEFYDPDQLEQRFGGTAPNVTQYYPPVKFQPSATYSNKVSQTRASIQRAQQNIMEQGNQYTLTGKEDNLYLSDYKYKSQNPSLHQSGAAPVQHRQSLQQDIYLLKSPSMQVNYDIPQQQNYGSKSVTLQYSQPNINNQAFQTQQNTVQNQNIQTYAPAPYQIIKKEQTLEVQQSPLRFSKSQKDSYNKVTLQPPGFRDELAEKKSIQHVQLARQQQTISNYNIVNDVHVDQKNLLDDIDDQNDKVKRSKKNDTGRQTDIYLAYQQSTKFEGKEPKDSINYMRDLKDQNYNACFIF